MNEQWVQRLIDLGVHYVWFHTYRPVGDQAHPELALSPEQVLRVRRFIVKLRKTMPIGVIDAYWDDKGEALTFADTPKRDYRVEIARLDLAAAVTEESG